jgi:chaperonin GroES
MKSKINPLHDRVIIEPIQVNNVTSGGIIIPDTVKEKPVKGKVIAVGKGKPEEPLTVKVGNIVLYGKHSGLDIVVDDKPYLIMKESDIFAIV